MTKPTNAKVASMLRKSAAALHDVGEALSVIGWDTTAERVLSDSRDLLAMAETFWPDREKKKRKKRLRGDFLRYNIPTGNQTTPPAKTKTMNASAITAPSAKIKLTRTETGWSFRGLEIERRKWDLPISCTSYWLKRDGKMIEETDSLSEMRDLLASLVEEGEI